MGSRFDAANDTALARYLPMFDPEHFQDPAFFVEPERIGVRQVLLGGTGSADLQEAVRAIKAATSLRVVLYPGGPGALADADLVVLPDVMNSNSHFARPFGSGPVATAMNVLQRGIPFIPVAYFIMGNSTAAWFHDAFKLPSQKVLLGYASYARMVGYRWLALDHEDPALDIEPGLIRALRGIPDLHLVISDEFTPERAAAALEMGADTVITPSDIYEEASDPLALAARFWEVLGGG